MTPTLRAVLVQQQWRQNRKRKRELEQAPPPEE